MKVTLMRSKYFIILYRPSGVKFSFSFLVMLELKPRSLHMLGGCSTTELPPSNSGTNFFSLLHNFREGRFILTLDLSNLSMLSFLFLLSKEFHFFT